MPSEVLPLIGTSLPSVSTCLLLFLCLLFTLTISILNLLLAILLRDELLDWILSGVTSSSSYTLINCEEIAVINLTIRADQVNWKDNLLIYSIIHNTYKKACTVSRRLLEVKGKLMLVTDCDVIKAVPESTESLVTSYVLTILCGEQSNV